MNILRKKAVNILKINQLKLATINEACSHNLIDLQTRSKSFYDFD